MRRLYLHLPRFPLQRKVRETPSLKGAPIALCSEVQGHRRVQFASAAAQREGVRPGMTVTAAQALIPGLHVFAYDAETENKALSSLGETLLALAPAFELRAPEGLLLDASAAPLCKGPHSPEENLSAAVLELCLSLGYRGKVALASQTFVAQALARYGENRAVVVGAFESQAALAPLPLLPLEEVEQGVSAQLSAIGISTLGEVAALPAGAVVARLGAAGLRAHALCRGVDETPLLPAVLPEQIDEKVELDWPAESLEPLAFALKTVLDRVCGRLCGRAQAAVKLSLRLRLDPSGEHHLPLTLARPTSQSRLLLELLRHRLSDVQLENPIAAVRVTVDEAQKDPGQQLQLGDGPQGDAALEIVLSRLSTTLGEDALFAAELKAAHRPEAAYRPASFRPKERARGLLSEVIESSGQQELLSAEKKPNRPPSLPPGWSELEGEFGKTVTRPGRPDLKTEEQGPSPEEKAASAALTERPLRLFTRPTPLDVEVSHEGLVTHARILGRRRRAVAVSGPERLCGDWWDNEAFARDYFRVHFDGMGPVWLFRDDRDGRYYLQGMFD